MAAGLCFNSSLRRPGAGDRRISLRALVSYRRCNDANARPITCEQVGNEVAYNRARPAGASGDYTGRQDMGLGIPDNVDGTTFIPRAVQFQPAGMASGRLHLVQAQPELFKAWIDADGFAQASAVTANRRDDDLHKTDFAVGRHHLPVANIDPARVRRKFLLRPNDGTRGTRITRVEWTPYGIRLKVTP